jgi:hypothetical protein
MAHDAVCGPAEEFSPIGLEDAAVGEPFMKIGVGMLEKMEGEYDRFKLHKIMDPGTRTHEVTRDSITQIHHLDSAQGYAYEYAKEIRMTGENSFRIRHRMVNIGTKSLKGDVYNHNFFTLFQHLIHNRFVPIVEWLKATKIHTKFVFLHFLPLNHFVV